MVDDTRPDSTLFMIFDASGDLTWRKLGPALFNLYRGGWMPERFAVIKPVPHKSFPPSASLDWRPNRLLLAIQPEEGILLRFEVKKPGPKDPLRLPAQLIRPVAGERIWLVDQAAAARIAALDPV